MSKRTLAIGGLIAGGAYLAYRTAQSVASDAGSVFDMLSNPTQLPDATAAPDQSSGTFLSKLIPFESGGNPLAKNPNSSASGVWQFLKGTWVGLGGAWGSDPTKAFGGLTPSVDEQNAMMAKLVSQNATQLANAGIPVNDPTLYAAHLLGAPVAKAVLTADPSTPLASITGQAAVSLNKFPPTVGGFVSWLEGRMA